MTALLLALNAPDVLAIDVPAGVDLCSADENNPPKVRAAIACPGACEKEKLIWGGNFDCKVSKDGQLSSVCGCDQKAAGATSKKSK